MMATRLVPNRYKRAYAKMLDEQTPLFVYENRQGWRMIRVFKKGDSGYYKARIIAKSFRDSRKSAERYEAYIARELADVAPLMKANSD